jgi:hypothetical protein
MVFTISGGSERPVPSPPKQLLQEIHVWAETLTCKHHPGLNLTPH